MDASFMAQKLAWFRAVTSSKDTTNISMDE